MPKLTKRYVESLIPDPKETLIFWDTELKGFGVVVLPSGRLTYCLQYRNSDRVKKRIKIGVHGQITAEEARVIARKHLAAVTQGEDPVEQKKDTRQLPTMQQLAQDYLDRHASPRKSQTSLKEDQALLNKHILPHFGDKKVAIVTRRDVETLHLSMKETPYYANRMLALLSKMLSCAMAWGWRPDNPVRGMQRYHEEKRERFLNEEELERLWGVLEASPTQTAYLFKLLLLTGAREAEVRQATWEQFDFKKGVWTKPSAHTKQKRKEHVPLSEKTLLILQELKSLNTEESPYLFPGRVKDQPIQETKTSWRTIRKKAGLDNLRIHDLRHTYASHLVSSGLSLSIVGKLLGHTQASTTHRYAHLADEALKKATEVFGEKIRKLSAITPVYK